MIVKIKEELLKKTVFDDLTYLIGLCTRQYRYDLFIELSELSEEGLSIYNQLYDKDKAIIEELFVRLIQEGKTSPDIIIASNISNPSYFSLTEGIRFLEQSFPLIVENSENDAYFLDALFKNFKKESRKITRFKSNNWLVYDMGGGSTIVNNIRAKLKAFDDLPKENKTYLRCFVIIDSDKKYPDMPLTKPKRELIELLEQNKIPYHILEKREMDNYLPDPVFETIEDDRDFVNAYLNLTPVQKDYFDLEKGFNHQNLDSLPTEVRELYSDLPNDSSPLRHPFQFDNFKAEFPKLFEHEEVTKKSLLERTKHQKDSEELLHIIEKITALL